MEKRHEKTVSDLKRLQEIEEQKWDLYQESQKIKINCPHHDTEPKLVETLAYEYTPRGVCVVCGEERSDLTIDQKISCFKEFFQDGEDDEDCYYSDEKIKEMAEAGGYNMPSPSFCTKGKKDAPAEEN